MWLVWNIVGGVVRWASAALITAVGLMVGFLPEHWLAAVIGAPPTWLVHPLTRLAVVLVGVLLVAAILLVRHRAPVKIRFEPRDPWVHCLYGNVPVPGIVGTVHAGSTAATSITSTQIKTRKCIFVRFEVTGSGTFQAFIDNIEKLVDGEWRNTAFSQSLPLRWVQNQAYANLRISKHSRNYVDLVSFDEQYNQVFVKWETVFIYNQYIFASSGTYRLSVSCVAEDGALAKATFVLVWRNKWNDFDIEMEGGERGTVNWIEPPRIIGNVYSDQALHEMVIKPGWMYQHNPSRPDAKKAITFDPDGLIGGGNEFEHKWKIRDGLLEVRRGDGTLQHFFTYDPVLDRFLSTNSPDAGGPPGQFIFRAGTERP